MIARLDAPAAWEGMAQDVYAIWDLPAAVLLPPLYALVIPIPRAVLTEWRIRRPLPHRRTYSTAAEGLSCAAASMMFRSAMPALAGPGAHAPAWITLAAGCGLVSMAVRACLMLTAFAAAHSALALVVALPMVIVLQRSLRRAALAAAARTDAKTGLLEEFALLLPRTTPARALEITERIRQGISQLVIPRDGTTAIRITISIGVAVPSQARRTLDDLLAAADHAPYQAKRGGRDRVVMYADTPVPQVSQLLPLARANILPG